MFQRFPLIESGVELEKEKKKKKASEEARMPTTRRQLQREERWRYWEYADKRLYEDATQNGRLKMSAWYLVGWALFSYLWFYGNDFLWWPPWWLVASHFVGSLLLSLLFFATVECFIHGDNVSRRKAGLPPRRGVWSSTGSNSLKKRFSTGSDVRKKRFSLLIGIVTFVAAIGLFIIIIIISSIIGRVLSLILNPLLGWVMFFLGYSLKLDFLIPWEVSILVIPVLWPSYFILRNRMLKKRWLQWWEAHEKDVIREIEGANDDGSPH